MLKINFIIWILSKLKHNIELKMDFPGRNYTFNISTNLITQLNNQ